MFKLPDLGYDFGALEPHIDATTMQIHHDLHHGTYVKNLNDLLKDSPDLLQMEIQDLVKSFDKVPEDVRQKVKNNAGGHSNHSFFWEIMTPGGENKPSGKLEEAINGKFESFEKFKEEFKAKALARFGSGWAWLVLSGENLEIIDTANQDTPLTLGHVPILGIDVWEHAYYIKFQNRRADYVDAWWNVVNWTKVGEFFEKAS